MSNHPIEKSTDKELVELLNERNIDGRYNELIDKAKSGYYHDFKSELATPKSQLVEDLSYFPELQDVRESIIDGDYDEPPGDDFDPMEILDFNDRT
jgi:hypothetical protein